MLTLTGNRTGSIVEDMSVSYKMRSTEGSIYDPARVEDVLSTVREPEVDDTEEDPYRYGYRERCESLPDGSTRLLWIPLTYEDTLDPQLGDRVSHSTIHTQLTVKISGILETRYEETPEVAVWSDLKMRTPSRGKGQGKERQRSPAEGARGPSPDVCVVGGVRDRDRLRESFELGNDPGEVWLAVEVVSKTSKEKDHGGILGRFDELKVREYLAVEPTGQYVDGPVELRAWERDETTKSLQEVSLDAEGRYHSKTTGLLFGPGPGAQGLEIRDAVTGELLCAPREEARRQTRRAEQAQERAEQAQERAEQAQERVEQAQERVEQAQERAEQEAKARRKAEKRVQQEKERVQQGLRQGIEDLCAVLGLAWGTERRAQVELMSTSQLEALRAHLVHEKSWPESFPEAS